MAGFTGLKHSWPDTGNWYREIASVVNNLLKGKTNNIGSVTLTANVTTTTVTLSEGQFGNDTVILFEPTTLNSAGEVGAGGMYISSRDVTNKQFVITHANAASTDRTFNFILVG